MVRTLAPRTGCAAGVLLLALTACGPPPDGVERDPEVPRPAPTTATPTAAASGTPGAPDAPDGDPSPGTPGDNGTGTGTGNGTGNGTGTGTGTGTGNGDDGPGYPVEIAIACADEPTPATLLDLLAAEDLLPPGHQAEVTDGPYCSGDWHYAIVTMPDRDPAQLVSRGGTDPQLVTFGTDVCTPEVRAGAPDGILATATCD